MNGVRSPYSETLYARWRESVGQYATRTGSYMRKYFYDAEFTNPVPNYTIWSTSHTFNIFKDAKVYLKWRCGSSSNYGKYYVESPDGQSCIPYNDENTNSIADEEEQRKLTINYYYRR